jgi:hypothetical protein
MSDKEHKQPDRGEKEGREDTPSDEFELQGEQCTDRDPVDAKDDKKLKDCDAYYNSILELAGETDFIESTDLESTSDARGRKRKTPMGCHESGETSVFSSSPSSKQKENTSVQKLRSPVSYIGDRFIHGLGLERREIRNAVTNTQMLLYLLWRNLYWTRFYGPAAKANSPVSDRHSSAVGVMAPVKRLVVYLENMFIKVEPFLGSTPPGKEWIFKSILSMTRGPKRCLQIYPVVHLFKGEDIEEDATDLFDSSLGVSFMDERFCQRMSCALSGDTSNRMQLIPCPKGIALLHRKWMLAELQDALE